MASTNTTLPGKDIGCKWFIKNRGVHILMVKQTTIGPKHGGDRGSSLNNRLQGYNPWGKGEGGAGGDCGASSLAWPDPYREPEGDHIAVAVVRPVLPGKKEAEGRKSQVPRDN